MKGLYCAVLFLWPMLWCAPVLAAADAVPLRVIHQLPIVSACINGQGPYEFLLDTGTESTLVDQSLTEELQLNIVDRLQLISANGMHPVGRAIAESVTLGPKTVTSVELLVDDLRELHAVAPQLRGILGENFLSQLNFLLDYRHRQVKFGPPPEEGAAVRIPFTIQDGRILLTAVISGKEPLRFELDSGASTTMLFGTQSRDQVAPGTSAFLHNNEGSTAVGEVHIPELRIGSLMLHNMAAGVIESTGEQEAGVDGLLPTNLFDSVYFDFAEQSIFVTGKKITSAAK
ncbi:MAG TPA: pepsin/retropepsin-like aspartic protease family protein [Terriglobales bacterium]|jgi:predicted aspartyl protease|nr:pepsin/retropepsin-like aspartic protease family protein [Terriglobales bacterium]